MERALFKEGPGAYFFFDENMHAFNEQKMYNSHSQNNVPLRVTGRRRLENGLENEPGSF